MVFSSNPPSALPVNLLNVRNEVTLSHLNLQSSAFFQKEEDPIAKTVKLTSRERRFIKFASVEYDGQLYMTPQDFLESFVEEEPRREFFINPPPPSLILDYQIHNFVRVPAYMFFVDLKFSISIWKLTYYLSVNQENVCPPVWCA